MEQLHKSHATFGPACVQECNSRRTMTDLAAIRKARVCWLFRRKVGQFRDTFCIRNAIHTLNPSFNLRIQRTGRFESVQ